MIKQKHLKNLFQEVYMKILCLGDSITDCGRLLSSPPLGEGYVKELKRLSTCDGYSWQFYNKGTDGFTISRLLNCVTSQNLPLHADLITLLIGINDMGLMMNTQRTHKQQETMMRTFLEQYEILLKALLLHCSNIILMEPFLFSRPAKYLNWFPLLKTMQEEILFLSQTYALPHLPLHTFFIEAADRYGVSSLTTDGIHLTKYGHQLLAELLYQTIKMNIL